MGDSCFIPLQLVGEAVDLRPPTICGFCLSPPATRQLAGREPEIYLKTEFNENQGQFSPDGRFIAYASDASGRDEIYVRPFPQCLGRQVDDFHRRRYRAPLERRRQGAVLYFRRFENDGGGGEHQSGI